MKIRQSKWLPVLILALAALMIFAAGCGSDDKQSEPNNQQQGVDQKEQLAVTLYFSDDQAMHLIPEERTIEVASEQPAAVGKAVLEELIAGPTTEGLNRIMPDDTEVLAVEVTDAVAQVDLNQAFKDNHWGGSEGEIHTLYSIVNTLAKNIDVTAVQFTIEGQVDESILGHIDTSEPLAPDFDIIKE
ncbi:GerMN domain-containing protein [Peptococcaceae bacterium 1198_IL3148]